MEEKFATGVANTGGKFATGVVDTGGNFAAGVVDTGGAPWLANISANFRKNSKRSKWNTLGLGGNWFMKKTRSKKSRDTVPLMLTFDNEVYSEGILETSEKESSPRLVVLYTRLNIFLANQRSFYS